VRHAPTRLDILTAERKLERSRRDTVESFRRFRSALRSRLAQPSSVALAVGLAALIGFWLMRPNKPRTPRASNGTSSMAGLAIAFLIRFGWERLSSLRDSSASRQKHSAAGVFPDEPLECPARQE